LVGQGVELRASRAMVATNGGFSLAGHTTLKTSRQLFAGQGDFVLAGQPVSLLKKLVMSARSGDFVISGQSIQFAASRVLMAGPGAFVLECGIATLVITYQKYEIFFNANSTTIR
jgi:hypothetical protein